MRRLAFLLLVAVCSCVGDDRSSAVPAASVPPPGDAAAAILEAGAEPAAADEVKRPEVGTPAAQAQRPVFKRPDHVRALYLNAWSAGSTKRVGQLIDIASRTEINSFVIDIKDASGYVSHRTGVEAAVDAGATGQIRVRDLPGLLAKLQAAGIYPIARIVIVRDPILVAARPSLGVQAASGGVWKDGKGIVWMNIANKELWNYELALAEEVAKMGFPEIQWDYLRFPDAPKAEMVQARFPGLEGRPKEEAVRDFLDYAGKRLDALGLDVVHTADVFGVTTSTPDVGIGQVWEKFIDKLDVALPMVYPSHYYSGSFGYSKPNFYPYEVVRAALEHASERSKAVPGAGKIRPYLQDFSLGQPSYGAPEVRAQIQAAYDAGIQDWVLWNAGSHYTEAALQPRDGWKEEPRIRIANEVVPVSKRSEYIKAKKSSTTATAAKKPAAADKPASKSAAAHEAAPKPAGKPAAKATAATSAAKRPAAEREARAKTVKPAERKAPAARTQPRVLNADSLRRWVDSVSAARGR